MAKKAIAKQKIEKDISTGECCFCGDKFAKSKMNQHLKTCKARQAKNSAQEGQDEAPFHLLIEGKYRPEYWMHIEMPARTRLFELDDFLRAVWVECCEHLSSFEIGGVSYDMPGPLALFENSTLQIVGPDGSLLSESITVDEEKVEANEEEEDDSDPSVELIAEQISDSLAAEFHSDLKDVPVEQIEAKLEQMLQSNAATHMLPPSMVADMKPFISYMATLLQKGELGNMLEEMEIEEDEDATEVMFGDLLSVGRKFMYTYDFGSSTTLTCRVLAQRAGVVPEIVSEEDEEDLDEEDELASDEDDDASGVSILIMAQNVAPALVCHLCGKPATSVPANGSEYDRLEDIALCASCARESSYDTDELSPLVNSPRIGVCGYDGDEEWDEEDLLDDTDDDDED